MIRLEGIAVKYGGRTVFGAEHLAFEVGRSYAVLGANGSGKTTLLRLLSGNLKPDSGNIVFDEVLKPGDIAYMPQKPYAFGFSVWRNVSMALPGHLAKDQARETALSALMQVGMQDFAYQKGNRLSGGEQQRMAFARMIVRPHRLLLLDEPTSSTDIAGNDQVENALREYRQKTGCTIIFASHSPSQAMRIADDALFLHNGRVVESGLADRVIREPESQEGKAFLQHWRV